MRYTYSVVTLAISQKINSLVRLCEDNLGTVSSLRDAPVSKTIVCRKGVPQNALEPGMLVRQFGYRTLRVRAVPNSKGRDSRRLPSDKRACYTARGLGACRGFHSSDLETAHRWAADRPPVSCASPRHTALCTARGEEDAAVTLSEQPTTNFLLFPLRTIS